MRAIQHIQSLSAIAALLSPPAFAICQNAAAPIAARDERPNSWRARIGDPAPSLKDVRWTSVLASGPSPRATVFVLSSIIPIDWLSSPPEVEDVCAAMRGSHATNTLAVIELRRGPSPTAESSSSSEQPKHRVGFDESGSVYDALVGSRTLHQPIAIVSDQSGRIAWIGALSTAPCVAKRILAGALDAAKFDADLRRNFDDIDKAASSAKQGDSAPLSAAVKAAVERFPELRAMFEHKRFLIAMREQNSTRAIESADAVYQSADLSQLNLVTDVASHVEMSDAAASTDRARKEAAFRGWTRAVELTGSTRTQILQDAAQAAARLAKWQDAVKFQTLAVLTLPERLRTDAERQLEAYQKERIRPEEPSGLFPAGKP